MKLSTVRKRCPEGEVYVFKNGVAEVPGLRISGKPVKITLAEFKELTDGKILRV